MGSKISSDKSNSEQLHREMLRIAQRLQVTDPEITAKLFVKWVYDGNHTLSELKTIMMNRQEYKNRKVIRGNLLNAEARIEFLRSSYWELSAVGYEEAVELSTENLNKIVVFCDPVVPGNLTMMYTDKENGSFHVNMYNVNRQWSEKRRSLTEISRSVFPNATIV
jgi:hypothetical protein